MNNRVIKFRAWNTTYNWMEDNFYIGAHDGTAYDVPSRTFDTPNTEIEESPDYVIMQFTGLHDKNGVELYEGDIVKAHSFVFDGAERDNEFVGKIVFSKDCCFAIEAGGAQYAFCETSHFDEPCIEVIGNIHENKELLS